MPWTQIWPLWADLLTIACNNWQTNGEWAKTIRRCVFVQEQGIPEHEEWDEHDANALHAVAWLNHQAVGTARLLNSGKIGRMAVLPNLRGQGIGSAMLNALLQEALRQGLQEVKLSAQKHAMPFYARHGFEALGPPHMEVGIAHQWMRKPLSCNTQ
ncbi:GNAT family N-acetyltransferase [Limnobacter sp.]|uniref:GNAT family N-acetyltransferase n=1 Tax=Limnobacter sp. TaxID=2003368 RepID=UPI003513529A